MRVPGTARLAETVNLWTAASGRRCVYWHPEDDVLLGSLRLPPPSSDEVEPVSDHLINEEGLFSNLTDEQKRGLSRLNEPMRSNRPGMTIWDLPWPIPRRIFEWNESENEKT